MTENRSGGQIKGVQRKIPGMRLSLKMRITVVARLEGYGGGSSWGVYYYCLIANNHKMEVTYRNSIYLASMFVYFPGWAQGGWSDCSILFHVPLPSGTISVS